MPFTGKEFLNLVYGIEAKLDELHQALEEVEEDTYVHEVLRRECQKLTEQIEKLYNSHLDFVRTPIVSDELAGGVEDGAGVVVVVVVVVVPSV